MKTYYVYIMANKRNGTLYIGMTSNISRRIYEHQNGLLKGFSEKYATKNLVYCELTDDVNAALRREKTLKSWNHSWKIRLIEKANPYWKDMAKSF